MKELLIRQMYASDIPEAAKIFINAYAYEPWNENWTEEDAIARITDYFNYPNSRCYVAFLGNDMMGGILCDVLRWHKGKQIEIKELFIQPDIQNKGIGSALFSKMETEAAKECIGEIIFWTDIHPKMQSFYTKNGCKILDDNVIMHKNIDILYNGD